MNCEACRAGAQTLTDSEIAQLQRQVPNWSVVERNGIKRVERNFRFKNFAEALAFTNKVARIAEEEGHHPAILTEWGRVFVAWWTHKIRGLHQNDFVMAARTDREYREWHREPGKHYIDIKHELETAGRAPKPSFRRRDEVAS